MYKLQFLLLIAVICDTVDNCAPLKVLFVFNGPILRAAGSNSTVELYGGTVLLLVLSLIYRTIQVQVP